jgi:hypothetical protein
MEVRWTCSFSGISGWETNQAEQASNQYKLALSEQLINVHQCANLASCM